MYYCQGCGEHPAKRHVTFYQNIGVLVLRFSQTVQGNLCSGCINKYFWQCTGITFLLGWWGIISFIVTPFFLLNNLLNYVGLLGETLPNDPDWNDAGPVRSLPSRDSDGSAECYHCGKPLGSEDGSSRVCRACR